MKYGLDTIKFFITITYPDGMKMDTYAHTMDTTLSLIDGARYDEAQIQVFPRGALTFEQISNWGVIK